MGGSVEMNHGNILSITASILISCSGTLEMEDVTSGVDLEKSRLSSLANTR